MAKRGVHVVVAASGMLILCSAVIQADDPAAAETVSTQPPAPEKTGKERLSDKASDEQRVDNCKVPPERRGTKVRPNDCSQSDLKVPLN